ncbi:prothymosin alpha-A-like [Papaver somniferum]|uniref:prothymosin alpha-A-like n=1 Tax=Papaver somniferum TaxID=3469 RepID=UPI000E70411D|nr:prothymosin alpha-A-like [Papaver somniferum]
MKKDVVETRRHCQRIQRRGAWKPSWGKARSMTESDSEDEEKKKLCNAEYDDSNDGKEIEGLDVDGNHMVVGSPVHGSVVGDNIGDDEDKDEDEDLQGPYATSDEDDGTTPYYELDELN